MANTRPGPTALAPTCPGGRPSSTTGLLSKRLCAPSVLTQRTYVHVGYRLNLIARFDPAAAPFVVRAGTKLAATFIVAQQYGATVIAATNAVAIGQKETTGDRLARQQFGSALRTLSASLRMASRFEPAVSQAQQAVAVLRALDGEEPGAYRRDLAEALRALAVALLPVGHPAGAARAAAESVEIYTALATGDRHKFRTVLEDARTVLAVARRAASAATP
ncbi:hypothetical protein HH310_25570 [Actinoplanes sp. TBRC 11911]|uniref:hypothetical protein n=1 Tax=Actinoplanes sp. TBRC 11911 TaxID=2729386 RepID=UPI00145DEC11|nr:hypothetical protein [Actinoplanes sp. TBRC 11911]NMO54539.1 hypothetical protein [Actinoplanes sp. TBRC 11911]